MEDSDDSRDTLILQSDDEDAPALAQVYQSFNNRIILGSKPCRPASDDSEIDETERNSATKQIQYENRGSDVKQRVRKRSQKHKNRRRRSEKSHLNTDTDTRGVIDETCEHCGEVFTDIKVFSAHAKAVIVPKNKSRYQNMISKKLRQDQRLINKNTNTKLKTVVKSRKMCTKLLSNRNNSDCSKTLKRKKKYSNDDRNRYFEKHNDKNQNNKRKLRSIDTASKKFRLDDETKVLNKENANSKVAEIYKCICGLHFTSIQFVEKHFDVCNNNVVQKEFCSRCNLPFATECLVDHLWRHHHGNGDCSFRFVYVEKPESLLVENDKGVETAISEKPPLSVMGIDPCLIKELHFVDDGILLESNDGEYDEHNLEIDKQKDFIAKTSTNQHDMGNLSTCNTAVENLKEHQLPVAVNVQENNNHKEIKEKQTEFKYIMQHDIEELNLMKQTICCEVSSSNTAFSLHDIKKLQDENEILEIDEDQPFYEEKIKEESEKNTDEKETQEVSELQDENEILEIDEDRPFYEEKIKEESEKNRNKKETQEVSELKDENEILEIDEDQPFYEEKIKEETEKNTNEKETQEVSEINQEIDNDYECFKKIINVKGSSEVVTETNMEINKDHENFMSSLEKDKTDAKTNEKSLKESCSNAATENNIDIFKQSSKTIKNATKKLINANNLRKCSGLDKNNNKNNKKPHRNVNCNTKKDHVNENKRVEKASEQMTKQIRTKARRWISQQNLTAQYFGNMVTSFYGRIVYRCHKCSFYFARRDALFKHYKDCSDKIEGSPCPICNLSFAKGLTYHVYVHHAVMGLKLDEIKIIEDALNANDITPSKHKPKKTVKEDCVKLDGCKVTKDTLKQNCNNTSFKDKPDNIIKDVSQIHVKTLFKDKPLKISKDNCLKLDEFKVTGDAEKASDITTFKDESEKTITFNSVKSLKVKIRGNDLQMNITSFINKPDEIVKVTCVNSCVPFDKNKIIRDTSETDHKTFFKDKLQKPINGNDVKLEDDKLMKNALRVKDINTLINIPDKTTINCMESNKVKDASQANSRIYSKDKNNFGIMHTDSDLNMSFKVNPLVSSVITNELELLPNNTASYNGSNENNNSKNIASETDDKTIFKDKPVINGNGVKSQDAKLMKNGLRIKDINTLKDKPDKSNEVKDKQVSQGISTVITSKLDVLRNNHKLQTSPSNSFRYYTHTQGTTHNGNANNTASYIGTNHMACNTSVYNNSQNIFAAKCTENDNCEFSKTVQNNYQTVNNSIGDNREYAHWIQSQNMNMNLNNDYRPVECPPHCMSGQNNPGFDRTSHFVPDYHNTLQPTPVVPYNFNSNPQNNNMTNYYHRKSNYDGHFANSHNSNLEQYNDFRNKYLQNNHSQFFNNIRNNILNNASSQCDYFQRGPYAPSDYVTSNHIRQLAYMCQYQQ